MQPENRRHKATNRGRKTAGEKEVQRNKMIRVEDKYRCSERDMLLLEARMKAVLRPDPAAGGRPYQITSLYFDDRNDSCRQASEDGVPERKKYRIRIYNNSPDLIKLEVKYKSYNRVFKKSKTISRQDAEKLMRGECIEDPDASMDSPVTLFNLALKKDLLKPKILIEYDRAAYVFPPGNVRITFDRDLRAGRDIQSFLTGNAVYAPVKEADRILEVKYDEFLPGFIARLLESGNMNQTAYSKYRLGRDLMQEV